MTLYKTINIKINFFMVKMWLTDLFLSCFLISQNSGTKNSKKKNERRRSLGPKHKSLYQRDQKYVNETLWMKREFFTLKCKRNMFIFN
jgi:hypothetical protein